MSDIHTLKAPAFEVQMKKVPTGYSVTCPWSTWRKFKTKKEARAWAKRLIAQRVNAWSYRRIA